MLITDFLQKDGSLLIPKEIVPFVDFKKNPIKIKCLECGNEFFQTHKHQKFCPTEEVKRSRCENRYCQRLKRQRRKEKEIKK